VLFRNATSFETDLNAINTPECERQSNSQRRVSGKNGKPAISLPFSRQGSETISIRIVSYAINFLRQSAGRSLQFRDCRRIDSVTTFPLLCPVVTFRGVGRPTRTELSRQSFMHPVAQTGRTKQIKSESL
jgi:hypothetical protein